MGIKNLSVQSLLKNKRAAILILLIMFLLLFVGFQKWKGGAKIKLSLLPSADTNGEIQEILKRSSVLVSGGKVEEAIVFLNETLLKYPNQQDVLLQLGIAHRKGKAYLQSEQIYKRALQLYPDCIECENNLAVTLLMNGNAERAIGLLSLINQKKPNYPEAHFNLAVAYEKSGQTRNAVNAYQKYLQLVPQNVSHQEPAMARERVRHLQEGL